MDNSLCVTIDDFTSICRLCLKRDELKSIFKNDDSNQQSISTSQLITEFCGLKVCVL